jgi:MoaE-MoaD fusion protein
MTIRVKLFSIARERAGMDSVEVMLPEDADVAQLRLALCKACLPLATVLPICRVAMDQAYVEDDAKVIEGVEVAVLPPVSGG